MTRSRSSRIGGFGRFGGAALVALAASAILWPKADDPSTRTTVRFAEGEELHREAALLDLSTDGSLIVYRRDGSDGRGELWARRLSANTGAPIAGSRGAGLPAISPDGAEVAFVSEAGVSRLVVTSIGGTAPPRTVTDDVAPGGVRWSPDGRWLYYSNARWGLTRAPAGGGPAETLTRPDGEQHWGVEVLPGGRAVIYTASVADGGDPRIEVLDLETGKTDDLWSGSFARYSAGTGHLLFMDLVQPLLMAVPLDVAGLRFESEPVTAASALARRGRWPLYAVSGDGSLVFATPVGDVDVAPVWVDRDGTAEPVAPGWRFRGRPIYSSVALSPDDSWLAFSLPDEDGAWQLQVAELDRSDARVAAKLVSGEGRLNYRPTWSPDGRSLTFISDRGGQADLWEADLDGTTPPTRILDRQTVVRNGFRSPDGRWVVFREGEAPVADIRAIPSGEAGPPRRGVGGPADPVSAQSVGAAPGEGSPEAIPIVATVAGERSPTISEDGRWLAYTSNEAGRWDVWVTGFPDPRGGPWLASPDGGEEPVWSNDGGELFYRTLAGELASVGVDPNAADPLAAPTILFSMGPFLGSDGRAQYDVSADDRRFLMLRVEPSGDVRLLHIRGFAGSLAAGR